MNTTLEQPATATKLENRFDALRSVIYGSLFEPYEPGYLEAITGFNRHHQQHPAAVLVARAMTDVMAAINFARSQGLPIAVQATGHGVVRHADGGLLVNVSGLDSVRVDPKAQTVTFGPGATWAQVLEAARPYGLTGLVGDTPSVGATGFTLGGGYGWFGRKYGLACDSLFEVDLITADGRLRQVNAQTDPELFWALRGGGGGFGAVTSMTLRLYPVKTALAGQVIFPLEQAAPALRAYRDWVRTQPEEMTSRAMFMRGPDLDAMPPFLRNRVALMLQCAYTGDAETGRQAAQPLLELPGAIVAQALETAPADLAIFFGAAVPVAAIGRGELLDALTDEFLEAVMAQVSTPWAPPFLLELRHVGGAVSRGESAYAHRSANFLLNTHAMIPVPGLEATAQAFLDGAITTLAPFASGKIVHNFLNGDEGVERDRAAYTHAVHARLEAIKARLDPLKLFRFARTPGSRLESASKA